MRGAGLRLNNDVRRHWHCSVCGAQRRAGADVTSVRCECSGNPAMKLVETLRKDRPLKEAASPYLEFVFEPGELNPPSPPVEDLPPEENPSEASAGEEGLAEPPLDGGPDTRPRQPRGDSRPPRRPDRRDSNRQSNGGPREGAGPGAAGNRPPKGPRPDRPPRSPEAGREEAGRPEAAQLETPAQPRPPRRDRGSKESNRNPPPAPPADGFGEGIPDSPN